MKFAAKTKSSATVTIGILAAVTLSITSVLFFPTVSYGGNWAYGGSDWKYINDDSTCKALEWFQDTDGFWYYLDADGNLLTDAVTPDGYTVGKDGAWLPTIPQIHRYAHIVPDETCNNLAGKQVEPIFQVDTDKALVSLSFDSGSSGGYTDEILEILAKYKIHSTFFLTKEWMESHEADVKKIHEQGHEIGNHTVSHPDLTKLGAQQIAVQIQDTHAKIKELTGQDAFLFRTPFGAYNTAVINAVKDNGYYCIQWTADSLDWKNLGVQPIIDRILNSGRLKNGAIILMHNGADYTPKALETVIEGILDRGYQIIPVSELIYTRDYKIDGSGVQHSTKPAE